MFIGNTHSACKRDMGSTSGMKSNVSDVGLSAFEGLSNVVSHELRAK